MALQQNIGQRIRTEQRVLEEKEFLIEDINLLIGEYTAGTERNVIRECIAPQELPWYHFSSYSLSALAAFSMITSAAGVIIFCTLSIHIGILFMTTGIVGGILATCGTLKNREFQVLGPEEDLELGMRFN
jgi:hypothetical protein